MPYLGMADQGMFKDLKIRLDGPYFNAGVLLIDLTLWRTLKIGERCLSLAEQYCGHFGWQDQCLLNAALHGRVQLLDSRWNRQTASLTNSFLFSPFDPLEIWWKNPKCNLVIHFTGPEKPWFADCNHPQREEYLKYAKVALGDSWPPLQFCRKTDDQLDAVAARIKGLTFRAYQLHRLNLPWLLAALDGTLYLIMNLWRAPKSCFLGAQAVIAGVKRRAGMETHA